jgi:hypothetical protein
MGKGDMGPQANLGKGVIVGKSQDGKVTWVKARWKIVKRDTTI